MGGFAADIDWDDPAPHSRIDPMLSLIPLHSPDGTVALLLENAAIGEARPEGTEGPTSIVTDGRFSIVGDLRLWNTTGLRSRAGGSHATVGMDDRRLLIAAYARTGIGFLEDVDGDFAFVIWDSKRRRVLAVRDRFAARPLVYERTSSGVRFATEAKQLLAASHQPPRPNGAAIAEYLTGSYRDRRHTLFEGISRVAPAHYLLADRSRTIEHEYWAPSFEPTELRSPNDVADEFRERLIESVRRRTNSASGVVAHLSGGLDSSSITAAAAIADGRGTLSSDFQTVSAVFADTATDESPWIQETAARQPFVHHDFVPATETVEQFGEVMWQADGPVHNRIRGIWAGTAEIADSADAGLVLMGSGGDEAVEQAQLLADLLRSGQFRRWRRGVAAEAQWFGAPGAFYAEQSLRRALPAGVKRRLQQLGGPTVRSQASLATAELIATHVPRAMSADASPDAPSYTQRLAASATRAPLRCLLNEVQSAEYRRSNTDVSYPFLDQALLEFIASVPPGLRPFDGSRKALTRQAFVGFLPPSVLNRRTKTTAGLYLDGVFARVAIEYSNRYPTITEAAETLLDHARYAGALARWRTHAATRSDREALWNAWALMQWLDELRRYQADLR